MKKRGEEEEDEKGRLEKKHRTKAIKIESVRSKSIGIYVVCHIYSLELIAFLFI